MEYEGLPSPPAPRLLPVTLPPCPDAPPQLSPEDVTPSVFCADTPASSAGATTTWASDAPNSSALGAVGRVLTHTAGALKGLPDEELLEYVSSLID
ncbi:hypothetical protein BDY19DRAFT_956226 [Irpex rosettiformis]|uniref:Uncharacterized protein n=1 Tax=Irpex rosettiformis TaxID=378272 RepID=A0ACB8TYH9_9APHY|nr:hypothetical protein BDY19DRAFT_956226 [Irpex rosettiformis]